MKLWFIITIHILVFLFAVWYYGTGIVRKEKVYINYEHYSMHRLLMDKCSSDELKWLLAALDVYAGDKTGYTPDINRTSLMDEILKVQVARFSQWEFGVDEERTIKPYVDTLCTQSYNEVKSELMNNCTSSELYKIINNIDSAMCEVNDEEDSSAEMAECIVNVKRENTFLNTTHLIDKFCLEQKLYLLTNTLDVSCSGKQIKMLFTELTKEKFRTVKCSQCIDKNEFIKAVVEVKRQYYNEVRILSMMRKFCIEPELELLTKKMAKRCTGGEVKTILREILSTSPSCYEKAECIESVIDVKRRQFKEIEINSLIYQFCIKGVDE